MSIDDAAPARNAAVRPAATPDEIDLAIATLAGPDLAPIVEMVLLSRDGGYEAHAVDGSVRFRRTDPGRGADRGPGPARNWTFTVESVSGRNPLGDQSTDRFAGLAAELAERFPDRTANAYPFAYEQVAQLFDHPHAPDVCVVHTASHHWAEAGGHIGEHGSLGAVQCRAPFVISGPGVRSDGPVASAAQMVDVAPTVLALLGIDPSELAGADGRPIEAVLDRDALDRGDGPDHVVGFLLDGCNPNVLHDAMERGEVPHLASLLEEGAALRDGIVSSLPTVTLPNHTTVITGRHPGHHGILHNAWWDRELGEQVITNSPETWATAMTALLPGTDSIHLAIQRAEPGAFTASVNEPADHGASFSTFDLMRRGVRMVDFPRSAEGLPHSSEMFVRPVKDYALFTQVDHHGTEQAVGLVEGNYLGVDYPLPRFLWVNFALTDSAFHEGGPHSDIARASLRDTDGRVGEVLAALERRGIRDRTAVFLCADHGMEESDPAVGGDWSPALAAAGLDHRDEAFGFIYLNP